jgi:hypothetical protein
LKTPPGYQLMACHMVFDVKLESFQCKAWLVAGGHMTTTPNVPMYVASVVSCMTVWIALTLAALNDLEVQTSDITKCIFVLPM